MIIELASTVILFLAFIGFAGKRGLTYMHVYQQEEYDTPRFLSWMLAHWVFDKRLSVLILIAAGASLFISAFFVNFIIFLGFALTTYLEKDPRKNSKKKLVLTARAKRIFVPAYVLSVLAASWCFISAIPTPLDPLFWLINVQLVPFMIMLVNMALSPVENATQQKFWDEANQKVLDLNPTVIGITGSFGKTSVKHILGHILKSQASTLITPGSVNTPMGIARIVREQLEPNHKFLIVEMGAYGPGSIERLCRLTPPNMGIISAIGHAHYERFKTLDAVAKTKYELAESVVGKGGQMIVHERTMRFEYARNLREQYKKNFVVCGESPPATKAGKAEAHFLEKGDLEIHKIIQTVHGLEVRFTWKGTIYNVEAPLYGIHHGHNIALAFAMAFELNISSKDIQTALQSVPQIEHRLEVRKQPGNLTVIDDAFNSNPLGFQSALNLLSTLGQSGRKILITPGMVELGKIHDEAHKKIGRSAGEVCDVVIVVQPKRIPTFIEGVKETGANKKIMDVESFAEAQKWIVENKQDGDVVLLENDLPDLYENVPKM